MREEKGGEKSRGRRVGKEKRSGRTTEGKGGYKGKEERGGKEEKRKREIGREERRGRMREGK